MQGDHTGRTGRHWEHRPEPEWEDFTFNQPYARGLNRLHNEVLDKTDFDPGTLFQWGTMQAMAIIGILKGVEARFGAEGQRVVLDALYAVGKDIGEQITEGTTIPESMSDAQWNSFYATIINRVAYASLESPEIVSDDNVNFHIDWCPHQDHYEAFDCRVQRYFVQGMIDAATEHAAKFGRAFSWDVTACSTIPSGAKTCFFDLTAGDPNDSRVWGEYTKALEARALSIVAVTDSSSSGRPA